MAALKMTTQKKNTSTSTKDSSDAPHNKNAHDDAVKKKKARDAEKPEPSDQLALKSPQSKGQATYKKPASATTKEPSTRSRPSKQNSSEKYFARTSKDGSSFRGKNDQKNISGGRPLPRKGNPFRRLPKEQLNADFKNSMEQPTQAKDRSSPKAGSTSETKPLGSLEKFLKGPKKPLKKESAGQLSADHEKKGTLKAIEERKAIRRPRSTGSVDSEGMRSTKSNVRRKTSDRASLPRTGSKNSLTNRLDTPTLPPRRAKARPKPSASRIEAGEALQGQGMRIQKWLSMQGVASRREAEEWINERKVFVNGKLVLEQGLRIDPMVDKVTVLGRHISDVPPPRVYWMLNKPDMVLTSRPDGTGRLSIYDLHSTKDLQFLVSPVGRLDFRTEGLLLLSNDGELVHRLAHPKYKVPRYYNVLIDGRLNHEEEAFIRRGIELEDGPTGKTELLFAHSVNLGQSRGSWYFITVYEGRNRLVRRLFEYFGFKVVRLVRYGFGDLRLPDDLPAGEYRQLTPSEIKYLKETVHLSGE